MTTLHREDPNIGIKPQDIRNLRRSMYLEFLDGRTPIQALLIAVSEEGDWIVNYEAEDDVVQAVFCVHKSSIPLLQGNSYILVMDCTY
jgi:hypothetical protein